ncbi:MAG: hypothetical protein H0V89_00185 [Deltaproteobacteria bacterium]|nr:hypothetical protein [Deltaproteobacteria bacterium]
MSRWIGAPASVALILLLAWWSALNLGGAVGWRDLVDHPERRDGEQVVLSLVSVGPVLAPDRYVVRHGSLPIEIIGDPRGLRQGEDVTIGGRFSAADRAVHAEWIERRPDRTGKKLLGVLGIAVLAAFLPTCWRLGPDGIETRG